MVIFQTNTYLKQVYIFRWGVMIIRHSRRTC